MKRNFTLLGILFAFSTSGAELPEVKQYNEALILLGKEKTTLESVFQIGLKMAKVLETKIEAMSESDFKNLEKNIKGFSLNREEYIAVKPKADFFEELAKKSSNMADSLFFENLRATYKNGSSIQDYYQLVTDVTACVDFDSSALTDAYGRWSSFKKLYPQNYAATVETELLDLENALLKDCVCGAKEGYAQQLTKFKKLFPHSTLIEKIKGQELKLKQNIKNFRFNCRPN